MADSASPARLESPSPTPPSAATVDFSCRLPVSVSGQTSLTSGFVQFPAASFTADPGGGFTVDQSTGSYRLLSTKLPRLIGGATQSVFYDRAYQRWIPAPRAAVYPDGSRYAYITGGSSQTVRVVEVATGTEQVFAAPHPINGGVVDYSPSGIYLAGVGEASETGVWLLNPQNGTERLLSQEKIVVAVNAGRSWLSQSPTGAPSPDTLVQLDLATGAKTVWFSRPGQTVVLDGLTADGLPVISLTNAATYLLRSPSTRDQIYSGGNWFANVSSDAHGVWMNSFDGLYLYVPGNGLHLVVSGVMATAGSCV